MRRRRVSAYVPMIKVVTVEEVHHALPYAHLLRVRFDPSLGVRLYVATHTMSICGRRLMPLYQAICAHTTNLLLRSVTAMRQLPAMPASQS